MRELVIAVLKLGIMLMLFILMVALPVMKLGVAYDQGTITGEQVAWLVIVLLLYKPVTAFISGFIKSND